MNEKARQIVTVLCPYGSRLDEDMMFNWLDKIPDVLGYKGKGVELFIDLREGEIEEESLRELISLFYRYELDLFELKKLETTDNRHWFKSPDAYWYSGIFENKSSTRSIGGEHRKWWDKIVERAKGGIKVGKK